MKRYRLLPYYDFDTRATLLNIKIKDEWEEETKKQHYQIRKDLINSLIDEYGKNANKIKIKNFSDLGAKHFSIIAFHNKFFNQIRNSFVIGAYFPSLTGVCTLGERILNYLMLILREDYKKTPQYKNIYDKKSFDNWDIPIKTLSEWGIFLPETTKHFQELQKIRNKSIHFNRLIEKDARDIALDAIKNMNGIINNQFSSMSNGNQPWFLNIKGESYIKRDWENKPFINKVYIPQCALIGYQHEIKSIYPKIIIDDNKIYPSIQISDDEYCCLRTKFLEEINRKKS